MRLFILVFWTILVFSLLGCEKAADISSPVKYEKSNVSFLYPQNWKVTEDVTQQDVRYIYVESPGDAIFIVQIYSEQDALPLNDYVEWFSSQSRENMPFGNIGKTSFSDIESHFSTLHMKGVKERFTVTLLGERVPHERKYHSMVAKGKVAFFIAQTATEDLNKVDPGFDLILSSFVVN